jgi:transmembrane sensor
MAEDLHILFGKYLSGEITRGESLQLQEWLDLNDQNREEFKAAQEIWFASGEMKEPRFDTDKAWQKLSQKVNYIPRAPKIFSLQRTIMSAAAALLIVLAAWWLLSVPGNMQSITASADVETVKLPDASVVYLRKGSTLKFPSKFTDHKREVALEGEGFFEVTHNVSKPFIITAGDANVQVVGTSFSVISKNSKVELLVKTGKVKFSSRTDTTSQVLVVPGEKALLADHKVIKSVNTDMNFNSWQSKQLLFTNTPLHQVLLSLNDHYNVNIVVLSSDSAKISNNGITASFNNEPLDSVLDQLSMITGYHIAQKKAGEYEISIK